MPDDARPHDVEVAVADPASAEARHCLTAYFHELDERFDTGFDPTLSIQIDVGEMRPPTGLFLLATVNAHPVGCGVLRFHPGEPTELKRMWVSPSVRGHGVGRRLLEELERYAAAAGATAVRLETNRTLTEAISMYRRCGYTEVPAFNDEAYAHHWFEKHLDRPDSSR